MKMKKSLPDVIIAIVVLIFLGTLFAQVPAIPEISRGYPLGLLVVATVMTAYLLIKNLISLKGDEVIETKIAEQAKTIAPYCLMIIAYIWLLNKLGYIISTVVFMICSLTFLKLKNKVLMVVLSVIMTLLGYLMQRNNFPTSPVALALLLGTNMEKAFSLTRTMYEGRMLEVFKRPLFTALMLFTIFSFAYPLIKMNLRKRRAQRQAEGGARAE